MVLTNRYPPYYTGGYEIACHSVIERLRSRGYEILVLTSNYGLKGVAIDGHVHRLLHRPQDTSSLLQLSRWELSDNRTLRDLIKSWKPDVIYAWSMLQLFSSLYPVLAESGIPVVFNVQDYWLPKHLAEGDRLREYWNKPGTNPVKAIAKTSIRKGIKTLHPEWLHPITINDVKLDHIVFCSEFRQKQHLENGLPLGDSRVIYNGVDTRIFNGAPSRPISEGLRLIFVGRLVEEKGAHTAIEALAELHRRGFKKVSLSIAGVPSYPWRYSEYLYNLVEKHGLSTHVRFIEMMQNHLMPELYKQHVVLVFTSICDEGFPVTIIEAMACGVAVVGTTTGGSKEILLDQENCLTYPAGDKTALADRIEILFNNQQFCSDIAVRGQAYVNRNLTIDNIADQTLDYFAEII